MVANTPVYVHLLNRKDFLEMLDELHFAICIFKVLINFACRIRIEFANAYSEDKRPRSRSRDRASRYDTGISRFDTGIRYDTVISRYDTGISRFDAGISRYDAGTGISRYDTGISTQQVRY